jgi:hypothetical protein
VAALSEAVGILIVLASLVIIFGIPGWALVDIARRPSDAFEVADSCAHKNVRSVVAAAMAGSFRPLWVAPTAPAGAPNNAPERRPPPSPVQCRTAHPACSRTASTVGAGLFGPRSDPVSHRRTL